MTNFIESGDDVKIYDAQNSIHLEHELMYQKDFSWHRGLLDNSLYV